MKLLLLAGVAVLFASCADDHGSLTLDHYCRSGGVYVDQRGDHWLGMTPPTEGRPKQFARISRVQFDDICRVF